MAEVSVISFIVAIQGGEVRLGRIDQTMAVISSELRIQCARKYGHDCLLLLLLARALLVDIETICQVANRLQSFNIVAIPFGTRVGECNVVEHFNMGWPWKPDLAK